MRRFKLIANVTLFVGLLGAVNAFNSIASAASSSSALSDEPIPMKTDEEMPQRVAPLL